MDFLIILAIALITWAAVAWDNRHHIKHDRWHDED